MKRGILVLMVLAVAATGFAQDSSMLGRIMVELEAAGDLRVLGELADIDEDTMKQVIELRNEADEEIRKARSEVDIVKAQVQRLLLEDDPDLDEIEDLLREASEWEVRIRMAEIERDVAIRQLVGDNAWARLLRSRRILGEAQRLRMEAATRERFEMMEQQLLNREKDFFQRRLRELEERLENGDSEAAERIEQLRRELERELPYRSERRR